MNPGDTRTPSQWGTRSDTLNEGRGVNPGDTGPAVREAFNGVRALNEGRGVNPRDTTNAQEMDQHFFNAQRRPRCEPRRHLEDDRLAWPRKRALNEGRGVNPGDTLNVGFAAIGAVVARSTKAEV